MHVNRAEGKKEKFDQSAAFKTQLRICFINLFLSARNDNWTSVIFRLCFARN